MKHNNWNQEAQLVIRNYAIAWTFDNLAGLFLTLRRRSLAPLKRRLFRFEFHRLGMSLALFTLIFRLLRRDRLRLFSSLFPPSRSGTSESVLSTPASSPSKQLLSDPPSDLKWTRKEGKTFCSASVASLAFLLLPKSRRIDITLTASVRALDVVMSTAINRSKKFQKPDDVIAWISTLVFIMSAWEIMWSWFYYPSSLPRSYVSWISSLSELDPDVLTFIRNLKDGKVAYGRVSGFGLETSLIPFCERRGIDPKLVDVSNRDFIECFDVLHQGQYCLHHALFRSWRGFVRALALYLPLYIFPVLLGFARSQRKLFMSLNYGNVDWSSLFLGMARSCFAAFRSSAFLGTFIGLIWNTECQIRNYNRSDSIWGPCFGSLASGMSILIERPSRRAELAFYVLPRAIYSLIYRNVWMRVRSTKSRSKWLKVLDLIQTVSFGLSVGTLVKHSVHSKDNVRPMIRTVINYLLHL
eukprot:Partr_v1_DN28876_c1_g1_i2_m34366 putative integral membrane protein